MRKVVEIIRKPVCSICKGHGFVKVKGGKKPCLCQTKTLLTKAE